MDVEVVGAGFAGLACASACAARGLTTVVWERKPDPGASVHTTGLLVKELADEEDLPLETTRKIRGIRLFGPSLRWLDLDAPGYFFLATDTSALLRSFADRARAQGVEIRCGRGFTGERRAPVLVGADGPRSTVARLAGLGRNQEFLVGVEAELEGPVELEERLHVFLDRDLAPGYIGWVVPGVGITQVGLACRRPARPDLDAFLARVGAVVDLSRTEVAGRRGGLIPVGGRVRPFASADVVLVGDAAGLVSPLTAGGIHMARRSGRAAGIAIASHLTDGAPSPDMTLRTIYPRFAIKGLLRAGLDLGPPNRLVDMAIGHRAFRKLAQLVFFHHRGLLSPSGRRALVGANDPIGTGGPP